MKQPKTRLKLTVLLMAIAFMVVSCQKDDVITDVEPIGQQEPSGFTLKNLNREQLESNATLIETLHRTGYVYGSQKTQVLARQQHDQELGITIYTDNAKYIEDSSNGNHSYNFFIQRNTGESTNHLENLLLHSNPQGGYDAYIIRYGFTSEAYPYLTEAEINNVSSTLTPIAIDTSTILGGTAFRLVYGCSETWSYITHTEHNGDLHGVSNDGTCTVKDCNFGISEWAMTSMECGFYDDGNGNGYGDTGSPPSSGSSGQGGGNNNNSNPPGNNNGQGDNGGNDGNETFPVLGAPTTRLTAAIERIEACLGMTIPWFNEMGNSQTVLEIDNYLISQNNCSVEAKGFTEAVIEEPNAEVDFAYEVIVDSSFANNPCLYSVYETMGKAPIFNNYLQNFEPQFSVAHLKLSASTTLSDSINAVTSAPQNYLIRITFNENNLDRPRLFVARTFIHEMIHAEIFRKMLSCSGLPHVNFNNYTEEQWVNYIVNLQNSFPGIYDYYVRWAVQNQNPSAQQHEMMAQHYRDIIEQALREFDDSHSDEIYEALAWVGLQNTVSWNNLSQTERDNISQTVTDFENNNENCQ